MFQAVQAVIEMAEQPSDGDDTLYTRFRELANMIEDMNEVTQRAFNLALIRLLYEVVQAVRRPRPTEPVQDPQKLMQELMAGQDPEVVRATMAAFDARSLPDYIRAVNYNELASVHNADLGYAAAVILRRVLTPLRGTRPDALVRWVVLGPVVNAVAAAHYLRGER
jgi:cysteinyl-tRNA synthetase